MAVGAYLQTAASQLRRAAQESMREAESVRATLHESEIKTRVEKNSLERQLRNAQQEERHAENSDIRHEKAAEVQRLQQEIANLERQFNDEKAQRLREVDDKQGKVQELNNEASLLERKAASI